MLYWMDFVIVFGTQVEEDDKDSVIKVFVHRFEKLVSEIWKVGSGLLIVMLWLYLGFLH